MSHPLLSTIQYDSLLRGIRDVGAMQVSVQQAAIESGQAIEGQEIKEDGSDVSKVDKASDALIRDLLGRISKYPVLSEEVSVEQNIEVMKSDQPIWIVDPLDGTSNYLDLDPDYSIEVALMSAPDANGERKPIFGLSYLPSYGKAFYVGQHGTALSAKLNNQEGEALFLEDPKAMTSTKIHVADGEKPELIRVATGSKAWTKSVFANCAHNMTDFYSPHSSMEVASGNADAYSCSHEVKYWDMAAKVAILEAADCTALPVDLMTKQFIDSKFYFGADATKCYEGKPFTVPCYTSVNNSFLPYLDYAPGVEMPVTASRSPTP